jgi:hypothetical protein
MLGGSTQKDVPEAETGWAGVAELPGDMVTRMVSDAGLVPHRFLVLRTTFAVPINPSFQSSSTVSLLPKTVPALAGNTSQKYVLKPLG